MKAYRGRFAPTPSGPLHYGSMVAAIGSYCDARAHGGQWQVRIDDIDAPRVVRGAASDILRTLEAFCLEWDGRPIYQSENREAYHLALHQLRAGRHLYPCACSRKEISETGISGIDGPVYDGRCRAGLPAERAARSLRLRVDANVIAGFDDVLQQRVDQHLASAVGDFVLYRADGAFTYHLACAVDDALQGITHVIRGADLIDSTPRQVHLQQLLGFARPVYLHLPVATGAGGEKLSKQTQAPAVSRDHPGHGIFAVLHFLGQQPPTELRLWPARDAIEWAVAQWQREKLPAARALPLRLP